jgi:hypothetical protein
MKKVLFAMILLVLLAVPALAATEASGGFDASAMTIVGYVVAVLFNIGAVAGLRSRAATKGKAFLSSGRFAFIAVYLLCFVELLITGRFGALENSAALIDLIQQASVMATAAVGTHSVAKTSGLNSSLLKFLIGGTLVIALTVTFVAMPTIALAGESSSLLGNTAAFTPIYLHSLNSEENCIAGKVSVDLTSRTLKNGTTLVGAFDMLAVGDSGDMKLGCGISAAITNGILRLGVGVGYAPEQKWSLYASVIQWEL